MNQNDIDAIYFAYGYQINYRDDTFVVYTFEKGVYHGADFISFGKQRSEQYELTLSEYQRAGYACKERQYNSSSEVEESLFDTFFKLGLSLERNRRRYADYSDRQNRLSGALGYSFINPPYTTISSIPDSSRKNVLDDVLSLCQQDGPQLIIIEAPAGYGKTSLSFELFHRLTESDSQKRPLFTELSWNRKAPLFRYVLLDEIDREYSGLPSDIVIRAIKQGRIPVIIDGFDELLSRSISSIESSFEDGESMLTTIADILKDNAKIILTSRKTAVFSSDEFDLWINQLMVDFNVHRIQVEKPEIRDWLTEERHDRILQKDIPLRQFANPVILSYLRQLSDAEFEKAVEQTSSLVNSYFDRLLERERERQELSLPVEDQKQIFVRLCTFFIDHDFTAEVREMIAYFLLEGNRDIVSGYLKFASDLSEAEVVNKLVNHALLDRRGLSDQIGFVNDFILGVLVLEAVKQKSWSPSFIPSRIVDIATETASYYPEAIRQDFWEMVNSWQDKYHSSTVLLADLRLLSKTSRQYDQQEYKELSFDYALFDEFTVFSSCLFLECTFNNISLNTWTFSGCTFINCTFSECSVSADISRQSTVDYPLPSVFSGSCEEYSCSIIRYFSEPVRDNPIEISSPHIEHLILGEFFRVGGVIRRMRTLSSLFHTFDAYERSILVTAIDRLRKAGHIFVNGNNAHISTEGMREYHKNQIER